MPNIAVDVQIHKQLCEWLSKEFGLETDDPFVLGTAEGSCDLQDHIAAMLREALASEAQADGIKQHIKAMEAREERLNTRAGKLRAKAKWAMQEAGLPKISQPDFSVTMSAGQQRVVTTREADAADHATNFALVSSKYSWRKDALKKYIDAGVTFDFAYLSNPEPVMTVRTK